MSPRQTLRCALVLVVLGAGWGFTLPMMKPAVSGGYLQFGLSWAKLILAESNSPLIWLSLVLMVIGLYLVQPRRKPVLAGP